MSKLIDEGVRDMLNRPIAISVLIVSCAIGAPDIIPRPLEGDASLIAIGNRLERLQNFTAEYDVETTTNFDPDFIAAIDPSPKNIAQINKNGVNYVQNEHVSLKFLNGNVKCEISLDDKAIQTAIQHELDAMPLRTKAILSNRTEEFYQERGRRPGGLIEERGAVPEDWTLDVALGARLLRANEWLRITDFKHELFFSEPNGDLRFVTKDSQDRTHEFRFEKQLAYAVAYYRITYPNFPDSYDEIRCSDFHSVNGLLIPYKIVRQNTLRDAAKQLRHPFTRTYIVHKFIVDDPENTQENIAIKWPAKTLVRDMRTDVLITISEPRTLPDSAIADEFQKQRAGRQELEERAKGQIDRVGNRTTLPSN